MFFKVKIGKYKDQRDKYNNGYNRNWEMEYNMLAASFSRSNPPRDDGAIVYLLERDTNSRDGEYMLSNFLWFNIKSPKDVLSFSYNNYLKKLIVNLDNTSNNYPTLSQHNCDLILMDTDYVEQFEKFLEMDTGTLTSEVLKKEVED